MRLLMKGEDNNTNQEEEREKKMHVNTYYIYIFCKQLKFYTWHNKFITEHKFDKLPYFCKYLVCNI